MSEHKAREAEALSDEKEYADWVVALSPLGSFVGRRASGDLEREWELVEAYALNRGLQVDQRTGQAQIVTQLFPILLFPEVEGITLPEETYFIPFSKLHKHTKRNELYGALRLARDNRRKMRNMQDGVNIIVAGPNGIPKPPRYPQG